MRQALSAFAAQGVRAALNSWIELWEARAESARRLRSAGLAFRGDMTRKAMRSWASATAELLTMSRALFTLRFRSLKQCLMGWHVGAQLMARELEKQRRCLSTAASEWSGSRRRGAWLSWRDFVHERHLLIKAASCFRNPMQQRVLLTDRDLIYYCTHEACGS